MSIQTIPDQPLKLGPYLEPRYCEQEDPYCYKHQRLDPMRMQFRNISDGLAPGSCDPTFETIGSELLTNGDFAGSASGWTLTNATYGSDKVCFNGSPTASVLQSLSFGDFRFYKFIFTVSGITTGTMILTVGGRNIANIIADGTYAVYGYTVLTYDFEFSTVDSCDGCIESASMREMFPCWTYDNINFSINNNLATSGNSITHTPGTATTFTSSAALLEDGYYACKIRVQGRTQGSVQMFAGDIDALSTPITKNGIFTQYLYAHKTGGATGDPVDFYFVMDADFDGTVEYVYENVLRTDFVCTLLQSDGTPIADLSDKLVYSDDYVTLSIAGFQSITDYNNNPIEYGCYKISIIDRGGTSYTTDGEFNTPDPQTNWTENDYFVNGIYGNTANAVSDGTGQTNSYINQSLPGLVENDWYVATFKYRANFIDAGNSVEFVGGTPPGIVTNVLGNWQTLTSPPFQKIGPLTLAVRVKAVFGDDTAGNMISVDDVQVYAISQYVTNCISYQLEHPGTYLVVGRSNFIQAGDSGSGYGFGFLFQPRNLYVFFFIQRLSLGFRKPSYPDKYNAGAYSTGRHYKSFGSSEKILEVAFEAIGEIEHDCLAVMIQCPSFYIQGTDGVWFSENSRYHCITDEYSPNWVEDSKIALADSVIQVQHIQDIVKISNV